MVRRALHEQRGRGGEQLLWQHGRGRRGAGQRLEHDVDDLQGKMQILIGENGYRNMNMREKLNAHLCYMLKKHAFYGYGRGRIASKTSLLTSILRKEGN